MRKRILVLLTAIAMALTMTAAPAALAHSDGGYHDGSYRSSSYKDGPWCYWYGHGYEVVWGESHYYHGDSRAKRYYDDYGDPYYSCSYLDHRGYDHGHNNGYDDGDDD